MRKATTSTHMVFACSLIFLSITASCISQPGVGNGTNVSNSAPVNRQTPPPPALSGTASQKDGTNDVADGDGRKPPANLGGVDLVNMQLQIVESNLQVTFESSDPLPSSIPAGASTLWQVEVWSKEGSQGYYLGAKLVGSEWQAFIFNVKTATNMYVQSPSVSGKKLVANFPLSQLPNLGSTFTWSAVSEYDGKWGDEVPDEGKASFPAT